MAELWDIVDANGQKTGRFHERGKPMNPGDYHLSVSVWIVNGQGEFLISKRSPDARAGNMWETTGGSAVAGEDAITAALREVKEELGVSLDAGKGELYKSYTYPHSSGDGAAYITVWIFRQEVDLADVILQPGETCDVMWASADVIRGLVREGNFIAFDYLEDLFEKLK